VRRSPAREDRLALGRGRRGREVEIRTDAAEEGIPHRAADERELVTPGVECLGQLKSRGRETGQHG